MSDITGGRIDVERILKNSSDAAQTTNTGAQERFSESEMDEIKKSFSRRFKQAFDHANNAEIARRMKSTDAGIKLYTDGERLPNPEMLLQIKRVTGVSIDWLLTGQGDRHTRANNLFSEEEEREISKVAKETGKTFDQTVKSLALAAVKFLSEIKG